MKKLILLDPRSINPKLDECQLHLSTPFWIKCLAYITETRTSFLTLRYLGLLIFIYESCKYLDNTAAQQILHQRYLG
ncbi:unnamed protein product [Rotaria sp. Silwood1]|nr:unnamed protein product [Rotaria sp. Silwood1]